jgi:hypothetical protein
MIAAILLIDQYTSTLSVPTRRGTVNTSNDRRRSDDSLLGVGYECLRVKLSLL